MNFRCYGQPPFKVAVVHGGPGAPGEMAPVARDLAQTRGVLEPLQTALTIDGEVEELRQSIMEQATAPAILIGYSWGAWLSFILAARYPSLVSKLILVSSGPFTCEYAFTTNKTRFSRLNPSEQEELRALKFEMDNPDYAGDKNALMNRLGQIFSRVDDFDRLLSDGDMECRWDIFAGVWPEAAALRRSGALIGLAGGICCPVVAIHGDYDPHPAEGVRIPLSGVLRDFRFILLEKCGHTPWLERQANQRFYAVLREEIGS